MTTLTAKYFMVVPKEAGEDLDPRSGMRVDLRKWLNGYLQGNT
jgi:hypothetical protein